MSDSTPRIFLSPPHMSGREAELVAEAFASNYIAPVGPHITAFEREMEAYLGQGYCVALSSGTAAIHLALHIADIGPGDTVLCSDLTFAASANPILYQNATPVFIDAEPASWNLDPELLAEALDELAREGRTPKALILTQLYGQPADMAAITRLCEQHGLVLIEDAAEALGAKAVSADGQERPLGAFGRFGALSFNGNKIITTSGGGMLVCRDQADAERARFLATQARDPAPHYEHSVAGYNYRLSNVLAAIGRGQMEILDQRVARRREIFDLYVKELEDISDITFMPEPDYGQGNRWLTCVLFASPELPEQGYKQREAVRLALEAENIESRPVWKPMHLQPLYAQARCFGGLVGADLFTRGLCLPSGTQMADADIRRVAAIVRRTLQDLP